MKPTLNAELKAPKKAEWKTPELRTLDVGRTLSPNNTDGFVS